MKPREEVMSAAALGSWAPLEGVGSSLQSSHDRRNAEEHERLTQERRTGSKPTPLDPSATDTIHT